MEHVDVTIHDNEKIIVENVNAWIETSETPSGHLDTNGGFSLPGNMYIESGGPFKLETDDGRSGQIIITNVQESSQHPTEVYFKMTGPLN